MLLVGRHEGHPVCKKTVSVTVSCFSKIQIGLTFLVPAHLGSVCVCVCVCVCVLRADVLCTTVVHNGVHTDTSIS